MMPLQPLMPCIRSSLRQSLPSSSRCFSGSSTLLYPNDVPPESPSYIRLTSNFESEDPKAKRVRGHLPVPRQIFDRQDGDRKTRADYIRQTAPERTKAYPDNETQQWKAKMATARRNNLRGGLNALWQRHAQKESFREARLRHKREEQTKAAAAPERDDDVFTRGTVLESVLDTKVYPDPDRFSRVDRSRNKVTAIERAKREARRDALIELYMGATNFIVQESELQAEIDKIFTADYYTKQKMGTMNPGAAGNAWGVYGKPLSIANMLASTAGSATKSPMVDLNGSEHDHAAKAQKRIAEEFTGGKME
ncbi:hypothetical protein HJFPF1_01377 [Paramyrothecium foliicola]|nr:hypothetical protein HJFPF1_01377 [Paramyrothecium foliicola]